MGIILIGGCSGAALSCELRVRAFAHIDRDLQVGQALLDLESLVAKRNTICEAYQRRAIPHTEARGALRDVMQQHPMPPSSSATLGMRHVQGTRQVALL